MTKNITLAVDEDLLASFRVIAAEQRTTVNALIRKYMEDATGVAERRRAARAWMVAKTRENIAHDAELAAARERGEDVAEETWRWSREDTYSGRRFGGSGDD
jgi:hypothetical protein